MKKLPFLILLLALSSLTLSACAEKDASKKSATAETTPADIVQATAPVAAAAGEKKAASGSEPDCN